MVRCYTGCDWVVCWTVFGIREYDGGWRPAGTASAQNCSMGTTTQQQTQTRGRRVNLLAVLHRRSVTFQSQSINQSINQFYWRKGKNNHWHLQLVVFALQYFSKKVYYLPRHILLMSTTVLFLRCFDTVGWVTGTDPAHKSLWDFSSEVIFRKWWRK